MNTISRPRILPPVWLLIFLLLQAGTHFYLPLLRLLDMPLQLAGLIPLLVGIVIMVWGARAFSRADTPVVPFETSTALVKTGPFRFTRNPIYLGMTLILGGAALLWGSLAPLLTLALFFYIIRRQYFFPEENMMKEIFGDEYRSYCSGVRRWL